MRAYRSWGKRAIDAAVSAGAVVVLSPVLAATALAVRIALGSPVVFRQERPGLNGELFELYKFRTMTDARDGDGRLLPDSDRLTRFGSLLRSTSLDELPGLVNVLRGDMSLVGPRPLRTYYLPLYSSEQARRHQVRPGITGLAQVRGRNSLTWEEKFCLDVEYVDTLSLRLDLRILLETLSAVVARRGIAAAGSVTMPAFTGTAGSEDS